MHVYRVSEHFGEVSAYPKLTPKIDPISTRPGIIEVFILPPCRIGISRGMPQLGNLARPPRGQGLYLRVILLGIAIIGSAPHVAEAGRQQL
jgi:hypothetical protein